MLKIYNRLTLHHTGGSYEPNALDRKSYNEIVSGDGIVVKGTYPSDANAVGKRLISGRYFAHTRSLNGGNFGLSAACMLNHEWHNPKRGAYFPKKAQLDAFLKRAAEICQIYDIPVTRQTVLSHAEVQTTLGVPQAAKWDFDYDPFGEATTRDPIIIGDMLRDKISQHLRAAGGLILRPQTSQVIMDVLRRGAYGHAVEEAQRLLVSHGQKIGIDRAFGPNTENAVRAFQKSKQLYTDGVIGPATWSALYD